MRFRQLLPAFLVVHLVASYVYLGKSPVLDFTELTARNILSPLNGFSLRTGKVDFAPIIAVVMTFSVLFTFTDFQLIWALTRGGPVNSTHLMATLSYQRAILGGQLGEGAAISTAMIPFLVLAIMVSWYGLQRRKWQQGEN